MGWELASVKRRNKEIYSIIDTLKKCKKDGKEVFYELDDDNVGFHVYIGIKKCISLHITYGKNEILYLHYMVFFPSATLINNLLSVAYESEFSRELMKDVRYVVYLLDMGEDYSVVACTFLKRLKELEVEYIEDNPDYINNNEIDHLPFQEDDEDEIEF